MYTFAQKPKTTQQTISAKFALPSRAHFGQSDEVRANLRSQRMIGLLEGNSGDSTTTDTGRFGHDFSRIPIRPSEAAGMQRTAHEVVRIPVPGLQHNCACGGDCPSCKSEQSSQEGPHKGNPTIGNRANGHAASARGPRSDDLDDAPYRGPDESTTAELRGPGTGTGMGCVFGPMRVVTSGALEGGYTVNDYLSGGLSWGRVTSPGTAGSDGRGFKVQLCASYANDTSLGVSQTMTHGGSNQAFLDGTAAYLGRAAGSVTDGATFDEPVLNAGNPYAHTGWELQYGPKSGTGSGSLVSFADVPRAGPGEKGYVDFRTCFYSHGGPCQENNTCRTWRWTVDFTGTNNTNTIR